MKTRDGYIDALRGLAMLMVVFVHVEGFSLFIEEFHITILRRICEAVMLPLFFFISGFVSKRGSKLIERSLRLLIPAFVVGIIHSLTINKDIVSFIHNIYKYGYWYTITLFEMQILLFGITKISCKQNRIVLLLTAVSILLYVTKIPFNNISNLKHIGDTLCFHQLFIYFHFFSVGYILSSCKNIFNKILNSDLSILSSILIFFAAVFVKYTYTEEELASNIILKIYRFIQDPLLGYTGIIILFSLFNSCRETLSNTISGKALSIIGRHTLEIYLLHYFFLPTLPKIGIYLVNYPNLILELLVVVILSMGVIFTSLLLGKIIKVNNILGFILLGEKPNFLLETKKDR